MIEEITQIISNVGFPIACCVVLFINNTKFNDTLNNLNITLKEISTRLENVEEKLK